MRKIVASAAAATAAVVVPAGVATAGPTGGATLATSRNQLSRKPDVAAPGTVGFGGEAGGLAVGVAEQWGDDGRGRLQDEVPDRGGAAGECRDLVSAQMPLDGVAVRAGRRDRRLSIHSGELVVGVLCGPGCDLCP